VGVRSCRTMGEEDWQTEADRLRLVARHEMATAFGAPLLGTALVVISGFYRLPGQELR
jgi:hypothetical protein